jgi:hypothetical protein
VERAAFVSGNRSCSDWHLVEVNALQKSLHLFTTPALRCFGINAQIVLSSAVVIITGPRSARWSTTMRIKLFGKPDCIRQAAD